MSFLERKTFMVLLIIFVFWIFSLCFIWLTDFFVNLSICGGCMWDRQVRCWVFQLGDAVVIFADLMI